MSVKPFVYREFYGRGLFNMSCVNALDTQILTFLTAPKDILLLQHKVYREYAKIAIGPEFIHTLPSFIIITAISIVIWRHLALDWLTVFNKTIKKIVQAVSSWIIVNAVLWHWLILQRIIYCSVWTYWNNNVDIHDIASPWWQQVWASFYPPSSQPPVLSASLISWILSMSLSGSGLLTALHSDVIRINLTELLSKISENFKEKFVETHVQRKKNMVHHSTREDTPSTDMSDMTPFCDDCHAEISRDFENHNATSRRRILPVSNGTNWTPPPIFHGDHRRDFSVKSLKTVTGVTECKESENEFPPRQTRHQRGCHTVIPSSSSPKP